MEEVCGKPKQRTAKQAEETGSLSPTECHPVLLALSGCPRGRRKHLCTQNYENGTGRSSKNPLSPQCPGFLIEEGGAGYVHSSFPLGTLRTGPMEDEEAEGQGAPPIELRNHQSCCPALRRSSRSACLRCWKTVSGGSLKGTHPACLVFFSSRS